MSLDLTRLTMTDAASLLGYRKPAQHRQRVCESCGSDDLVWGTEYKGWGATPESTGFDYEYCTECDRPTGERVWVGF